HGDLRLDHFYILCHASPENADLIDDALRDAITVDGRMRELLIIDRIEFTDRFRWADPIADVAFLIMDLQARGAWALARCFADDYLRAAKDKREGERLLVLRDPLELCDPFAIDADFTPVIDALDGQRTPAQIRQSLLMRGQLDIDLEELQDFIAELGEAGFLDDDSFRARWTAAHDAFSDLELRPARRAGLLYPDDPEDLARWLAPALPPSRDPGPKASD
ncbi:MAG: hypothetical protein KC457_35865, partial [Myxococcales bacterium]|nr:hypothetical protein [Myxococcales bacterium]